MKFKILLFFLFYHFIGFSQVDIYYYKDIDNVLSLEDVKEKEFSLLENQINDGYTNATYWFKIPASITSSKYIFRFVYERYTHANVYQNFKEIEKLRNQRYLSYLFSREKDVFIKIKPKLHSYLPIEFDTEQNSLLKQKHQLILNSFYYGVTTFIIIINFIYFLLFKDDAFLYYAWFLGFMCFGIFTMDGMLNFYNIHGNINNIIMVLNYIFLAYFSSKFANSYLYLNKYYPKNKHFSYTLVVLILITGVLYIIYTTYYYFLILNILVFFLLFYCWFSSVLLFRESINNKILAFAYVLILFSAIDYFVLKFFGITFIDINARTIKIGAFIEMILLTFAVLYRLSILIKENDFMKNEIIKYSKELNELTTKSDFDSKKKDFDLLSIREKEIFDLIISNNTNKEIANALSISINTVKFHIKNIYEKLNIKSRKEALLLKNDH